MKTSISNLINRIWFATICLTSVYFAFTESEAFRTFFTIMGIVPLIQIIVFLFKNPR